jgi:NAD(P)-dependent dehydrogenase (short-subunit alcohol dehydrogenase family)
VKQLGPKAVGVRADAASLPDLAHLFGTVKAAKGKVDVLFVNAGIFEATPFGGISEDDYDRMFDINVKGLLFTVQEALPLLTDGASVILTGSVVGIKGFQASTVYSATKAAVRSFARSLTTDLKERKIRVNVVSPGPIATPGMDAYADRETQGQLAGIVPLARLGTADEVAKAVLFLASDDSSFVAGAELFVDGGLAQI